MEALIERRESGPAWMDKTSDLYAPDVEAIALARAQIEARDQLQSAISKGDANALCQFSMVTDWDAARRQPVDQSTAKSLPKRAQTLAEVLNDAINGYPEKETALIQLLLNACSSADESIATQARALRDSLVSKWVEISL
jgi:hypothetical protein